MSNSNARSLAKTMIRRRTHHNVTRGTINCTRVNSWTRHCNLAWTSGGYSYHASGRLWTYISSNGSYDYYDGSYDFRGTRTSLTCAKRHSCTQRFHWH
jgi:hypothetical protein